MPRTIEAFISKHFRRSKTGKWGKEEPGVAIDAAEAAKLCAELSARQRAALDADTIAALSDLLDDLLRTHPVHRYSHEVKALKAFAWFKARRAPELERTWATLAVLEGILRTKGDLGNHYVGQNARMRWCVESAADTIGKRALKLDAEQVFAAIESCHEIYEGKPRFDYRLLGPAMDGIVRLGTALRPAKADAKLLDKLRTQLVSHGYGASSRKCKDAIDEILVAGEGAKAQAAPELLWPGEPWAAAVNDSIKILRDKQRDVAARLLKYAGTASEYAKPSKAWFAGAQKVVDEIGQPQAAKLIGTWLKAFVDDDRAGMLAFYERWGNRLFDDRAVDGARYRQNTGYIAGVAHVARCVSGGGLLAVLGDVVEHVARAKHDVRENSIAAANAALRSIAASDDPQAASSLSMLTLRLRWPKLRKAAEKAMAEHVARRGISRDDLEETSVPDFGMTRGVLRIDVADGHAELTVGRSDRPRVSWHPPGKEPTRIVPKAWKASHREQVDAVTRAADEIEKTHAAQRTRIDLLFRREITWPQGTWRQRYLDHGFLGTFARRLIWLVNGAPAVFVDDAWQDVHGNPIDAPADATIALWHPASRAADEVLAWRQRLEALNISQPIKQAYREVYIITDAEFRTRTYSNRFAAHIVRNHATLAISQVRKWKMGLYGGASSPSLALPHFGLRAEWWLEAAGEETDRMGFPLYFMTDQVRFYRGDGTDPIALVDVPGLAFTEAMRDIDLFVSIASIGNNPEWHDAGPHERFRAYWQMYSFGDLGETARTRKAVLERLVPRLKIADRCKLAGNFLVVRGDLRTYKIHLGSANILMEPNDQYLCIVPDRGSKDPGSADGVFLPFEGDSALSIILSKAFLLAEDTAIQDTTITRQIRGA